MTRDDIIRMAQEADVWVAGQEPYQTQIERFAALVAAAERETCAKLAGPHLDGAIAAAIRARGEEQPYATQAAMVESQTHGRMQIDPATGNVSIGAIRARGE